MPLIIFGYKTHERTIFIKLRVVEDLFSSPNELYSRPVELRMSAWCIYQPAIATTANNNASHHYLTVNSGSQTSKFISMN